MLSHSVVCAYMKWSMPELIPRIHLFTRSSMSFGLIRLWLVLVSSCMFTFRSAIERKCWMVGRRFFHFLLLSTMVNCLFSLLLRAAVFLDCERWRV